MENLIKKEKLKEKLKLLRPTYENCFKVEDLYFTKNEINSEFDLDIFNKVCFSSIELKLIVSALEKMENSKANHNFFCVMSKDRIRISVSFIYGVE